MNKKLISFLLAFTMFATSIAIPVWADEMPEKNILTNTVDAVSTSRPTEEPTFLVQPTFKIAPTLTPEPISEVSDISLFSDLVDLSETLSGASVVIETNGEYVINNITSAYGITVKSGVDASLTINNVSITSTAVAPIKIESGATLNLNVKGVNTLSAPENYAGIAVCADSTTSYGSLIIDGDGTLNASSAKAAAGIGGNRKNTDSFTGIVGKITIKGGTVNATGGQAAAGIGAGYNCTVCNDITINGGIVNATSGANVATGIGGANSCTNGKITINGGYIIAKSIKYDYGIGFPKAKSDDAEIIVNGGSINSAFKTAPVDKLGVELRQIILKMPDSENMSNKEVTVDAWSAVTDENGKLYFYISETTTSVSVQYNGHIYVVSDINSETTEYTLTEYTGGICTCTMENSSVILDISDNITVNKLMGENNVKLKTVFQSAEDCTYPIHNISAVYNLTIDGAPADSSLAKIDGDYLVIYYAAVGKTININATATIDNGNEYNIQKNVTIIGDNTSRFNISKGNIDITADSSDSTKINVKSGSTTYKVDSSASIYIYQTTDVTDYVITVKGVNAHITIDSLNIKTALTSPFNIGDNISPTIELIGDNVFCSTNASAISGILATSALIIDGEGTLTSTSGVGAGIGNVKQLTVNGGTVIANGGSGGAGIGGSQDGSGQTVVINGGCVYAYGDGNAAGIGGGSSTTAGGGGSFTINGGMVYAKSGGSGCGIGYGGRTSAKGTITINGGSVNAKLSVRPQNTVNKQYLVKLGLEGVADRNDVSYSIGTDDSNRIVSSTDSDGKLYLYLNAGKQWIRVHMDGKTYYCYMTVVANDYNESTAVSDPVSNLISFTIAGQIGESIINNEDRTVEITVPYNIILESIVPITKYNAAEVRPEGAMDFSNESHTATYTLIGDDMQEKEYTIKLNLEDEPEIPQPDTYDISAGSIDIRGDYVRYGGTRYRTNELGYIIIGSTTTNNLHTDVATDKLPQITLKNVNITSYTSAIPLIVSANTDIAIEGVCSFAAMLGNAVNVNNVNNVKGGVNLNITGNGRLNIKSDNNNHAVLIEYGAKMNITDVATTILSDNGVNALSGTGSFYTNSETYMNITTAETPEIQVKDSEERPLYQLIAHLATTDKSATTCVYNEKTYYAGEDATLYLMLPDNDYEISINYSDDDYVGDVAINGKGVETTLYSIKVEDITYETMFAHKGGTVEFVVSGTNVIDRVKILLKPNDAELETLEATVKEADGKNVASIIIPENESFEKDINYTVYYVIKGEETSLSKQIVVLKNTTVCKVESFEISGQVSSSITESEALGNIITVIMPYDHTFKNHYTPSKINIVGNRVTPDADTPLAYTKVDNYLRGKYTVVAKDNTTTADYTVKIYCEATPKITSLSFKNPSTSSGGKVTVTARGTALGSIHNAELETNREVYIYSDNGIDPVKAECSYENGVYTYIAEIDVPENTSDTATANYPLKAKIGNVEQSGINSSIATVTVPRRDKTETRIKSFMVDGQIGETEITENAINITMPYDADITAITPSIFLEDINSTYSPIKEQDFTSPVKYIVTAENKTDTREYTVTLSKQTTPVATDIEFTNPQYSSAGRIEVKVNGTNLENAANAMNLTPNIVVNANLVGGTSEESTINAAEAVKDEDGNYIAMLTVPRNNTDMDREYTISVSIGGVVQTLSGNVTLKVPKKEANSKELTDIILTENQSALVWNGNVIYLYVPYNTDLNNITPEIYHTGVECTPEGAQNFNQEVTYTVKAQDGTYNEYKIQALRKGIAQIDDISFEQPKIFNDTEIEIDINGQFVPYITAGEEMDKVKVWAVSRDDGSIIDASLVYDSKVYGGHATATLSLPINNTTEEKIYDIKMSVNDVDQILGVKGIVTVPKRTTRSIFSFFVNGQNGTTQIVEDNENGNSILFNMPYSTDLTKITPIITIDGDDYSPKGVQDFENPVIYTVSAEGDEDRKYTATAKRDGLPSISSVTVRNTPDTFKGKTVNVDITGVFFYDIKVKAVAVDGGETIDGVVTMNEWHKATATIDIPTNKDTTAEKVYNLKFYLDNFEEPIAYAAAPQIKVPRRKTRAITNFMVNNQVGVAEIGESDIYLKVKYETDLKTITPTVTVDGDSYAPQGVQNFDNETKSLKYTVSAADDEPREYTVHISRDGNPSITKLTFLSPTNFKAGSVLVNFEGVFFEDAQVSVVSEDGQEISGTINSFEEGKASAVVNIPINYDTENEKVYQLKFIIDGVITSFIGGTEIIVPRRTTREITEFTLPQVQEGETKINGNDIYIDVPYHLDIKSITPEITFDADKITPNADLAQDFSDLNKPVKYKLSSAGDDDITYTLHITRIGKDPYLKSLTVENQASETEYENDNVKITLKSNAKLKEVEPIVEFEGADYYPKGPQDFTNSVKEPIVYTVVNKYNIEHKYYVSIDKKKSSGGSKSDSKPTSTPTIEPTIEPTYEPSVMPTPTATAKPEIKPYIEGYEKDGVMYFYPDNTITRAEVATILSILDEEFDKDTVYQDVFDDISENVWYRNYMNYAVSKGYISGYEDGTSRPEDMITRAEFASIIARYIDIEPFDGEDKFNDIEGIDWCRMHINALAEKGIITGYENEEFLPHNKLTRGEAVAIINRSIGRKMSPEILGGLTCPFSDVSKTHWAYNDILLAACEY